MNLGELLRGDRISVSDYELAMGKDEECKMLCSIDIDWMDVQWARGLVLSNYVVEWCV